MRQKSTTTASSVVARRGVVFGWAIRGSFRWGFGWPPFYSQTMQHSSSFPNSAKITYKHIGGQSRILRSSPELDLPLARSTYMLRHSTCKAYAPRSEDR